MIKNIKNDSKQLWTTLKEMRDKKANSASSFIEPDAHSSQTPLILPMTLMIFSFARLS
jgi:hypothetical protein